MESAACPVFLAGLDGRVTSANWAFHSLWGLPEGGCVGRPFSELVKEPKRVSQALEALRDGRSWVGDLEAARADNASLWVHAYLSTVRDADGTPVCLMGSLMDITGYTRAARALRESEEKFRRLADDSPGMIYIYQYRERRLVYANQRLVDVTGYSKEEFCAPSFDFRVLIAPESLPLAEDSLRTHLRGQEVPPFEYIGLTKGGRRFHAINTTRLIDYEGAPAVLGTITDVTARVRSEEAERERTLRVLRQQQVSLDLARQESLGWNKDVQRITEAGAGMLGVERVGVWLFSEDGSELRCEDLYLLSERSHGKEPALVVAEYPRYFAAARESRVLAAPAVQTDPRTSEFLESYLRPLGIASMMDLPVRHQGELIGIVCFEHTGTRREWPLEEQEFGAALADAVSLAYGADKRRRAEAFLNDVFDSFQDGISVLDREWNIVRVNKWVEKLRAERMPLVGRKCYEAYHARDSVCPWCPVARTLETGEAGSGVVPYSSRERSKGWLMLSSFPILGDSGEVVGAVEHVKDITAQRLTEEALRKSEERYRTLFESSREGIAATNLGGRITDCNPAFAEMLGQGIGDLVGTRYQDLVPKRWKTLSQDAVRQAMERGYSDVFEKELRRKDGVLVLVSLRVWRIKGEDGSPAGVWVMVRDITLRKKAEDALLASESRLKIILSSMHDMVFVYDEEGRFAHIFHTPSMDPLYASPAKFLGKNHSDVMPEGVHKLFAEAFKRNKKGMVAEYEYSMEARSVTRWYSAKLSPLFAEERFTGSVAVVRDITESKRSEAKLLQAQKLASVGQLAAGVAHEINNPLSALSGEIQWMLEKTTDKRLAKSLKFMEKVSQRIANIVSHLLTFSRETPEEAKESCSLNSVIGHALSLMERRFEQAGVALEKDLARELPSLRINRGRMEQVFMNVLLNSLDAMPDGGRLSVRSRLSRDGGWAEVVIEDTGVGVAEADLGRIFDPFYTTKPPGKGTGLGLSMSHGIVTSHGGTIELESKLGRGTRVSIRLPAGR
jgi:PAS domain S-box-containing protein